MKLTSFTTILLILVLLFTACSTNTQKSPSFIKYPENNAKNISPDTHLELIFPDKPIPGNSGKIRIYDATNNQMVDSLDMSIPAGPTEPNRMKAPYTPTPYIYTSENFTNANTKPGTPSGVALPTPDTFQLTIIGRFTDGFRFYPVIIHDSLATIYLHHNLLEYNKTYYVEMDSGVLALEDGSFKGIKGKKQWTFTTKKPPSPADSKLLVVAADGTGDFNTVQGAIDFIPDYQPERTTIFIKNGRYEEIVYFRNKTNVTFLGESRDSVIVCYFNNEVFNPHPDNITTNEWPGTFPSRRAAFMGDNSSGIHLVNMTIMSLNFEPAQAEGLLLTGEKNIVNNVTIYGSGDALQVNGSAYFTESSITGFGDNILGRGPAFFNNCEFISLGGPHMWIRNTDANHGNIFINCSFSTEGDIETVIARNPITNNRGFPYSEAVLINCKLEGLKPDGWGPFGDDTKNIHYWEFNSTNMKDGKPADVSKRHPVSRQLTMKNDSLIIANYSNPAYVLNGWEPELAPVILSQPKSKEIKKGGPVTFNVKVAAIPDAEYQWYKDGKVLENETNSRLKIKSVNVDDQGVYTVKVTNKAGTIVSNEARLKYK